VRDCVRLSKEDDAGYDTWDANAQGETHRLTMREGGFLFEHSASDYT